MPQLNILYIGSDEFFIQQRIPFLFLVYKKDKNSYASNIVPCMDFQNNTAEGKVCDVPMTDSWHPCLEERGFGFNDPKGGPCIFLKLNKVKFHPKILQKTNKRCR